MLPLIFAGAGVYLLLVGVDCVRHILCKKQFVWTFFRAALGTFTALLLLFSLATSQGLIGSQLAN